MDIYHEIRNERKGGGVCIFYMNLTPKNRSDLSITSDAIECLCIEILKKHSKKLILNFSYRPPQGEITLIEKHLKFPLLRHDLCKKEVLIMRDFYKSSIF